MSASDDDVSDTNIEHSNVDEATHKINLTAELLQSYVASRVHFATKDVCQQLTTCCAISSVRN